VHDFNARILDEVAHRPWPLPDRPWVMTQTWNDLLFAHWPLPSPLLSSRIPAGLELDVFDGQAWLGIVPFHMTNVAPRGVPALPWVSKFPELNVRTYVRVGDKPGVYFFSLDAANALAVRTARTLLNLPYYKAGMTVSSEEERVRYRSRRPGPPAAEFHATYGPTGAAFEPRRESLEYFLTERYCLYATHRSGRLYRLDIHHPPWALQAAVADIQVNTVAEASGITLPGTPPLLHFAKRQDIVAWPPTGT
jgi:uncharacterized protein